MPRPLTIASLLAATVLTYGCAGLSGPPESDDVPDRTTRVNDSYFAVIDSIRPASTDTGSVGGDVTTHSIRIRYDDRSYQTVVQAGVGGLRVGDSVRIEQGRVRAY